MKEILIFIVLLINLQNLLECTTPNFVWEKVIKVDPNTSNCLSEFFVEKIDNEYVYWLEYNLVVKEEFINRNFIFMKTDTLGNRIFQKNHIHYDSMAMGSLNIRKENNNYLFTGASYRPNGLWSDYQMRQFILDNNGDIIKSDIDTVNNIKSMYSAFFTYKNDSIYICGSNSGIRIFNQKAEFVRFQELDTSGINYSINNSVPLIFINDDGTYLTCMKGPNIIVPDNEKYFIFNKVDKNGKIYWTNRYFTDAYTLHQPWKILEQDDGYLLWIMLVENDRYYPNFIKLDYDGNVKWSNIFKEPIGILNIKQLAFSKNFVLYGNSFGKVDGKTIRINRVMILDSNTNIIWDYTWHSNNIRNVVADIQEKKNGNLVVFGYHENNDIMVCEIQKPTNSVKNTIESSSLEFFPNPATDYIVANFNDIGNQLINYKIIDINGCIVKEAEVANRSNIYINDLPKSIYIIELNYYDSDINETKYQSKKFIKL